MFLDSFTKMFHVNAFSTKSFLFEAQGILIQFIKGYSLADLAKKKKTSLSRRGKASVAKPSVPFSTSLAIIIRF